MKPIIFFSHSSLDSERIKTIKDYILDNTGNAVQIFMSSDGASIPFGKNWLKEIEDALTKCKVMFVWISPNSAKSSWIFFESGYAYSRGINVVPIGFDGIQLENIAPPLNILQGFNIKSTSSLNNIIAIINREFFLTFPEIFNDAFYSSVIKKASSENSPELLNYVESIQCTFHPKISTNGDITINIRQNWFPVCEEVLRNNNQTFTKQGAELFGIGYKIHSETAGGKITYPVISIDPMAINNIWNTLVAMNDALYEGAFTSIFLEINTHSNWQLPEGNFVISSRLLNTEVDLNTTHPNVIYRFRNVLFRINIVIEQASRPRRVRKELFLIIDRDNTDPIPILSLLKLLIDCRIITQM
jgi:hypothetical protein